MCFGRLKITHAVVEAAVATMVPRTQAILRALLRRCFSGSRAAIALRRQRTAALLQRCCRAARRRNRWSSRSLLMRDGVKAPASASIRALFASAQFFYFGRAKPSQNGFYRRRVKLLSGRVPRPESRHIATITNYPTAVAAAAFRGRRARLATFADPTQASL